MAYDKEAMYKQVLDVIKEHKLKHFDYIEGFVSPCTKTLYDLFPTKSDELHAIKRELDKNKISSKTKLRNNWEDSENPTLQIAAFKLIASDSERRALSTNWTELETEHKNLPDLSNLTYEQLLALRNGNPKDS
jgi:hypothetical protein